MVICDDNENVPQNYNTITYTLDNNQSALLKSVKAKVGKKVVKDPSAPVEDKKPANENKKTSAVALAYKGGNDPNYNLHGLLFFLSFCLLVVINF